MGSPTTIAPVSAPFYLATGNATDITPTADALLVYDAGGGIGTIDGCGPSPTVNGEIDLRVCASDGSNALIVLQLLGSGDARFWGGLTVENDLTAGGNVIAAGVLGMTTNSWEGASAPSPTGLLITWNLTDGYGETDFVNAGGSTGAFRWYNGPGGAEYDKNSIPIMELVSNGGLLVFGPIGTRDNSSAGASAPVNGCLIAWNLSDGLGETDFVNAGTTTGAFRWFSGAGSAAYDSTSIPIMQLDDAGNLTIGGDFTTEGNLTVENLAVNGDAVIQGNLSADSADFANPSTIAGSRILTQADLPPGGIPYPPAGIGVSTGSAWDDSIDPSTVAYMNAENQGKLKAYAGTGEALDITASHTAMGCGIGTPTVPIFSLVNASEPTNQKVWTMQGKPGYLGFSAEDDGGGDYYWMKVFRSGTDLTGVTITPPLTALAQITAPSVLVTGEIAAFPEGSAFIDCLTGTMGRLFAQSTNTALAGIALAGYSNSADGRYMAWLTCTEPSGPGSAVAAFGAPVTAPSITAPGNLGNLILTGTSSGAAGYGGAVVRGGGGATNTGLSLSPGLTSEGLNFGLDSSEGADKSGLFSFWSGGTGNNQVAWIDRAGNATFNGGLTALGGFALNGPTRLNVTPAGNGIYYDSFGPDNVTYGIYVFRTAHNDGSNNSVVFSTDTAANVIFQAGLTAYGAKNFAVPHPLIEGKDLVHSCLEGPETAVFYRGEAVTRHGRAEVMLPTYFEALTFDDERSVLLTQITESDDEPMALLAATRIIDGIFWIRSSEDVRVAWEVKAVRRIGVDRLNVVRDRVIPPEEEKPNAERSTRQTSRRTH